MPLPKRPFTTSSLTSTLKSTIASQPLLSNLTNIDRLSSQASSLAQKTPFFGNNNPLQQQNLHQNEFGGQQQQQVGVVGGGMMRAGNQAAVGANSASAPKPPMASTPTVDLSHLTEEERLMIQSVMAKAEMADMGMPVDTSATSSTNLPSHTSQALSQQTLQHQQLRNQHQQPQQGGYQNHTNTNNNNSTMQRQQLASSGVDLQQGGHRPNLGTKSILDARTSTVPSLGDQLINSTNSQFQMGQIQPPQSQRSQHAQQQQQQQQQQQHQQQPQQQPQPQQQQLVGKTQQNVPQQRLANQQQQRFEQVPSMSSFDQQQQALASQNVAMSNQQGMQMQTCGQPGANSQQLQQQQAMLMADEQARLMQANASATGLQQQVDFGQQQAIDHSDSIGQQRQQAQQLTAYQQQLVNLAPNQLDLSGGRPISGENVPMNLAACLAQQETQMGVASQHPAALADASALIQPQQPFASLAANQVTCLGPNQAVPTSLAYSTAATATQDSMRQQQQLLLLQQQQQLQQMQPQFHDPRSDIRFGPQIAHLAAGATNFADFEGNEHALSDQECPGVAGSSNHYHSRHNNGQHQQLEQRQQPSNCYNVVRRYDSVNEQQNPTAASRHFKGEQQRHNSISLDPFEMSETRTIQSYDLAQRSPQSAGRQFAARHKSQRQLPQPNLQQVAAANADRSLQSSSEQLHNNNNVCSTTTRSRAEDSRQEIQVPSARHQQQRTARDRAQAAAAGRDGRLSTRRKSPPAAPKVAGAARERKHAAASSPPYELESTSEVDDNVDGEDEDAVDEEFASEGDLVETARTTATRRPETGGSARRSQPQRESSAPSGANETSADSTAGGANDKSGEALRLLSELKLTEQANQVMEQQQLLIKQSQELIRLQLEQQALSQGLKKASGQQPGNSSSNAAAAITGEQAAAQAGRSQSRDDGQEHEDEFDATSQEKAQEQQRQLRRQESLQRARENGNSASKQQEAGNSPRARPESSSKKSTTFCDEQAIESDGFIEESARQFASNRTAGRRAAAAAAAANNSKNNNNNSNDDDESEQQQASARRSRAVERGGIAQKRPTAAGNSSANRTVCPSPRYNRDLLQSPTDTTDSDIEPISQANLRRQQQRLNQQQQRQQHGNKLKAGGAGLRRREPTGLPPSPLPVAAAIQLHQMQHQHFKHQQQQVSANQSNLRANFAARTGQSRAANLCSRSVTSSPNHYLERSGYLTDHNNNNRTRSASPDTLSEFGGQRRQRKRLPEPPTNTVPITPSMVRKMIQAQRTGAAPCKLLTSVNAQSTLLTNTHSPSRNSAFESHNAASAGAKGAAINSSSSAAAYSHHNHSELLDYQQSSTAANAAPASSQLLLAANPSPAACISNSRAPGGSLSSEREQLQLHRGAANQSTSNSAAAASADLNKFLSSTYGNSILRNSISDVKETPELDKLISNLDEYYGLGEGVGRAGSNSANLGTNTTANAATAAGRHARLARSNASAEVPPDHHHLITSHQHQSQAHRSLPFAASSSSNFASLVASPTRNIASQSYPYGSLTATSAPSKALLYGSSVPVSVAASSYNNYYSRRASEGEYNFGSSARLGSSSAATASRPYRISTLEEMRAGYNASNNGGQSSISRNPLLTSASAAYLNGRNSSASASYLNQYHSSPIRQSRYSASAAAAPILSASESLAREYQQTAPSNDFSWQPGSSSARLFERPASSSAFLQSHLYRPTVNSSSKYSRLLQNPTGSFDAEHLDYLSSAGAGDQHLHHLHQEPQRYRNLTLDNSKYSQATRTPATTTAAVGSIYESQPMSSKYDRQGLNDPSAQRAPAGPGAGLQQQSVFTNEFSVPYRRSYQQPQQWDLSQQKSFDLDSGHCYQQQNSFGPKPIGVSNATTLFGAEPRARSELRSNNQYIEPMIDSSAGYLNEPSMATQRLAASSPLPASQTTTSSHYLAQPATDYQMHLQQHHSATLGARPPEQLAPSRLQQPNVTSSSLANAVGASASTAGSAGFAPLTKDDIINNGPKFNSIGYRFRTENQNKYVAQARTVSITCLQSRYPHPYKRILLSKNPKDRIGNGIGVQIIGGQPMPSLHDKVNRCIVTSGAFVTEIFQSSNVYFLGELHEGDQIIEWNGVNLCNRSNEEVQQILLSQFSDEEVEIVYLHQDKFSEAYEVLDCPDAFKEPGNEPDPFEQFAEMNKSGHQTSMPVRRRSSFVDETPGKGSIRRKISLTSIAHLWTK